MRDIIKKHLPEPWRQHLKPVWRRWKHRPTFLRRIETDKPVFVIGHPRSGTSWLYKLLAVHPALAGGPETHLFNYYLKPFLHKDPFLPWGGINQWIEAEDKRRMIRRFVDGIFEYRLAEEQKRRIVEKTPEHALLIPEIKSLYPEAKFVHIARDGRDVMLSVFKYASNLPSPPKSVEEAAGEWVRTLEAVERMEEKFPGDILTIRYEDLVSSPEASLDQIFKFIGEPCSPGRIRAIVKQHPPSDKSVGNWLRKLSPEEADVFESTARDWLRTLDYELRLSG